MPQETNAKVVCMLSGGPDSTAMIWKYLTETGHIVHIHHVILDTNDVIRHQREWVAVQNILKWLRDPANGPKYNHGNSILDRLEGFTYSRLEFKGYGPPPDHFLYAMMGSMFFQSEYNPLRWGNHIKLFATGRNAEDGTTTGRAAYLKAKKLFETITDNRVEWITPMEHYGKREIIQMMPKELFDLTTSCSYPKKIDDKWEDCNECIGCARRIEGIYQAGVHSELPEWHKYIEDRTTNQIQGYEEMAICGQE